MRQRWCHLNDLAEIHLGYKSLQNEFYYLSNDTIEQFGIEKEYLRDIYVLSDFDTQKYFQSPEQSIWLFYCRSEEADLRGTGALKYIQTMAKRPATLKKQSSGKQLTIQRVLEEQGSGLWYAPKATPHSANIWLRKAFAGVFAPFLFDTPMIVDQRCNRVVPREGVTWHELAALMTTSLFALALEADGASSMGAGALEWKTKSLRYARIIDIRHFTKAQRSKLVTLAQKVWDKANPVDFVRDPPSVKPILDLDEYVLKLIDKPVKREDLYTDLHSTVKMRSEKAKARKLVSKGQEVSDVKQVAVSIALVIRPLLEAHQFPEHFYSSNHHKQIIEIPSGDELTLTADRFMTHGQMTVEDAQGNVLLDLNQSAHTIELIVRAMLLGRRRFSIPIDEELVITALKALFPWLEEVNREIEQGVAASAVGTRFEDQLEEAILCELGISSQVFKPEIWGRHYLPTILS